MSDRIAVMDQGRVLQIGSPVEIYEQPSSRFIAEFIGESNLMKGSISAQNGAMCTVNIGTLSVPASLSKNTVVTSGQEVVVLIRPEIIRLIPLNADETPMLTGTVLESIYQGSVVRYRIGALGQQLMVEIANRPDLPRIHSGDDIALYWNAECAVVIP